MTLLLLAACITEASFPSSVATVACTRSEECYKASFEQNYSDQGECREDQSDSMEDVVDCYLDECEFDADRAGDFLKELRDADCEDVDQAYGDLGDVFRHCDDEWAIAACLASAYF